MRAFLRNLKVAPEFVSNLCSVQCFMLWGLVGLKALFQAPPERATVVNFAADRALKRENTTRLSRNRREWS